MSPSPLHILKRAIKNRIYQRRYGFPPPPECTDWSGYERLLAFVQEHGIHRIEGDVVEIGVFLGGGTYKLCRFYERHAPEKRIIAVDVFDPTFDDTVCADGRTMRELYTSHLKRLNATSQLEVFRAVTAPCANLVLAVGDSKTVQIPCSRISFAYLDGNHSSEYVTSDFYRIWEKLADGGAVAFDDYGYDLPNVTQTINELIGKERHTIRRVYTSGPKTIFIVKGSTSAI